MQPVELDSDSLEIADMSPVGGSGGNMEFQARDNVKVESTNFSASCARMSFSQAKDWLIFEGDGRSDAELYKQEARARRFRQPRPRRSPTTSDETWSKRLPICRDQPGAAESARARGAYAALRSVRSTANRD